CAAWDASLSGYIF
nr:immunoglobulin light chain junction region [Macaca mulatta]MPO03079.1 immunoglobulin light chain junction region [Macaca mulatta]MPO03081.1 immunoglobulin light chain junction region [Macaca mulatta]MPO03955.1 immunoglobulin light chain junction region [Macaca mulatta]MPO04173.1 immunoglobulin light chain junction region [Macaca mulatta]